MSSGKRSWLRVSAPCEITRKHSISAFSCGRPELDDWLRRYALKSHASGNARVLVVTDEEDRVAAYVAISAASVARTQADSKLRRNAPDPVPMGLIARLAVRSDAQGRGIGPALLQEAVFRIANASESIGIRGILVHAADAEAAEFYEHMGFRRSPIDEMTLMVSLREIAAELERGGD